MQHDDPLIPFVEPTLLREGGRTWSRPAGFVHPELELKHQNSAMDDFINPFLQSSSWNHDMSASAKSYGGGGNSPPLCMIPSSMENLSAEDLYINDDNSSLFADTNLNYCINEDLFSGENLPQHDLQNYTPHLSRQESKTRNGSFSLQDLTKNNSTAGSFCSELNTSSSVTLPHNSLSVSNSIESSGSEPSGFPPSHGDAHSITSVPAMWSSSYSDVPIMGEGELQGFGLQVVGNDAGILKKTPLVNGQYSLLDNLPGPSLQDKDELCNSHMTNFADGHQIKLPRRFQPQQQVQNELHSLHLPFLASGSQMISSKVAGLQTRQQVFQPPEVNSTKHQTDNFSGNQSHLPPANGSVGDAAIKPRVRARRGQATDPHSIAERLRRVKIAERMKNLQELVPNSNKADKASMLDEIIDYVKFLQLQVKVLSMSRLGAAGAVVPLITDAQAEGSGSLFLSSSAGQRVANLSELHDDLAFEQEVVKLMESSVTTAMQYLQNKGLCLMPIALATAISNQKGSSDAILPDRRKPEVSQKVTTQSTLGLMDRNGGEDGPRDCNGAIKQEEALKSIGN